MQNIVFTIVAKNYIGLAQVLEGSVKAYSPDVQFYIIVADEIENTPGLPLNIVVAKNNIDIPVSQWKQMAFKYNLVEFCTAIKPYCFDFFFKQKDAGKVIYLDPDILTYSSLNPIFDELGNRSILITSHILNMYTPFKGDYPDHLFLVNGIFNLGFIAVNNTKVSQCFLQWWQNRMINGAYFDNDKGLATDQKWINFLPAIIPQDELVISRNAGMNAAPWNFFERELFFEQGKFLVKQRNQNVDISTTQLIFVHFSGYNYKSIINGSVSHKAEGFQQYEDWEPAFNQYATALEESNFLTFVNLTYTYNFFANGKNILSLHRRIYRRVLEIGEKIYDNPFYEGENSFYRNLKRKKLIDHTSSKHSADSVTHKSIKGFNSKLKWVNLFFSFLQKVVGVRRYSMLMRFLRRYTKEENQYFLFDAQNSNKLI